MTARSVTRAADVGVLERWFKLKENATTVSTQNAIQRNTRMMACGIIRSHFTNHSHRDRCGSSVASTRAGYGSFDTIVIIPFHGRTGVSR